MISINFDNAYLLLIAIPLLAILAVPFFLAVRKDNRNGHNVASGVLHVAMAILIAFAAAGTNLVTVVTETDVYVVADVSYSANKNYDAIDSYIKNVKKSLPQNGKLGVVCFGKDYEVLTGMGDPIKSVTGSVVDKSETNIVEALEYTGSLFKSDVVKRIVLITDGGISDTSDKDALKHAVEALRAEKVYVDAIYIDSNLPEGEKEVQVSSVEATQTVYLNHEETALATVQSNTEANVIVSLSQNGVTISEKAVSLSLGLNSVSFDLDTANVGTFEYEIRVEADEDGSPYNNSYYFSQTVTGTVSVLLVTDLEEDYRAAQELFGESATIDAYVDKKDVPYSVEDLCKYDEIVLSNVDVRTLANYTMLVESINTVVSMFGKSLVTFGNLSIQNQTDEVLQELDNILPVRFGNNNQDPKLYTIVIDSSRSMYQVSRLAIAKQAATQLVEMLDENDFVSVVTFYGDVRIVQSPIRALNKEDIIEKINDLDPMHGTLIGVALDEAYNLIKDLPFSDKQIMFISDGVSYANGIEGETKTPLEIVDDMYADGIALSVLDVGRKSSNYTQEAMATAEKLLQDMVEHGGGNYYYCDNPEELTDVMFGEVADDLTESVVVKTTQVDVNRRYDSVLSDIDLNFADINGYYVSNAKASANTILTVDYQKSNGGTVTVPLYAYWNYGNGKVSTFTSSLSGGWLDGWKASDTYEQFFRNVFSENTPSQKIDYPYTMDVVVDGKYANITLTPVSLHADAAASVSITLPNGEVITDSFVPEASLYEYRFVVPDTGKYAVTVTYSYGGNDYVAQADLILSYKEEYNSFAVFDASILYRSIGGDGVVSEDGKLSFENNLADVDMYTADLTLPLLIICAVLFVADIIIRKLKWSDIKSLFGRGKK